jgi:hypothetical protein
VAREAYLIVIDKLNKVWPGGRLARYLEKHLELDRNPPSPGKAALSTRYVLDMMVAVYQALLDDRDLRLAPLIPSESSSRRCLMVGAPTTAMAPANNP